ncbi:MAG: hypothetical protein KBC27_03640 [Rickettsiales bacterium]|nr:hypothetical protein [Rickettsiales bacterium]
MKKKYYFFIVIILSLIFVVVQTSRYWVPYYNYYFSKYEYLNPKNSNKFIVGTESAQCTDFYIPEAVKNVISAAYPDKEIVYRNDVQPHLIVREFAARGEGMKRKIFPKPASNCKWTAPHVLISAERKSFDPRRYKRDAPPVLNFVSREPIKQDEVYFPFLVWSSQFTNTRKQINYDRKFLLYVSSHCVKEREKLFALIREKDNSAEALGKCSNTRGGERAAGNWRNITDLFSQYNFVFAMENEQWPGYITEKILNVLQAGAIPIYWGDSNAVAEFFNPKAYIDVNKFKSLEEAAEYIVNFSKDSEKVKAMQREPMFKDNKVHELFLSDKNSPYVQKYAKLLKENYYNFLKHKKVID